jgi:hypothetical protein
MLLKKSKWSKSAFQIVLLIIPCIFFYSVNAQDTTAVLQGNALTKLRNFISTLNKVQQTPQTDSLLTITTALIQTTKTNKDNFQLRNIIVYFNHANNSIEKADKNSILPVQQFINNDLQLKIIGDHDTSHSFSTWDEMFEDKDVRVTAYINGVKQITGVFTVYWFNFDGSDRKALIHNNVFNKCSLAFFNPYHLDILLPGYITFWMKNNVSKQIYESDQDYYILEKKDASIDVNFNLIH